MAKRSEHFKKRWYKSRTMWLNIATVIIAVTAGLPTYLPFLSELISTAVMSKVLFGVGVVNLLLRKITKQAIG